MKVFSAEILAELLKEVATIFWYVEFQFLNTYRYTNADIKQYRDGNLYTSENFKIGEINQSVSFSIDSVTLEFLNANLGMSSILLSEDVANKPAIIGFCTVDSNYQIIDSYDFLTGFVTEWKIREKKAEIVVGNEFMLWNKKTLRKSAPSCPWVFKGAECGYSGVGMWCDQSYTRCVALSNTINFGGERFVQAIEDRKIYWGRSAPS